MKNSYYVHLPYREEATPWDPLRQELTELSDYFTAVFRYLEHALTDEGLTFHLTWKLDRLPSTGSDVVAIVMADEWAQVPAYAQDVLCTFKCYGAHPEMHVRPSDLTTATGWATLARDVRVGLAGLPERVRYHLQERQRPVEMPSHPIYPLPLGYGNQQDLPVVPMESRTTDVFFAGSVRHSESERRGLRRWIRSPKELSRTAMLKHLDATAEALPDMTVQLKLNNRFVLNAIGYGLARPGEVYTAEEYSRHLMNAKICLAPRGTSLETFRYYEGLRYGCVVITEPQPNHWFYRDAPAITVSRWSELEDLLPYLLDHPRLLQEKQEAALDWWNDVASEEAVGKYMVACITTQRKTVEHLNPAV